MTKKFLGIVLATCTLGSTMVAVHEMRTPLTLLSKLDNINGSFSYPLKRIEPVLCNKTSVNFWGGAYFRAAYNAYGPKQCDFCCGCNDVCVQANCDYNYDLCGCNCACASFNNCQACCQGNSICASNTNYIGCTCCPENKTPLASLFFGKATFGGQEAFNYASEVTSRPCYQYLLTATTTVSPKLDYKETGVVLGMHIERKAEGRDWRAGFNATLPIKSIEVVRHFDCDSADYSNLCQSQSDMFLNYTEMFFNLYGVRLCDSERFIGIGDLDTTLLVGYDFTDRSYLELVGGIRFPTAKTNKNPGRVYFVPAGNNGHFEARVGFDGGWRSKTWVGLSSDIYYSHVLQATEKKAAQFNCATVRGIGPCVDAKVKYGYFVGHLNMTIFHPEYQDLGMALGYEFYYKRHDKTCFATCNGADRMQDFFGVVNPINPSLMMNNTDILAHKVRGQFYNRWDSFELYAGASKVVGGYNCMNEGEVYMGFDVNF